MNVLSGQYIYEASLTAQGPEYNFGILVNHSAGPQKHDGRSQGGVNAFQIPQAHVQGMVQGPEAVPSSTARRGYHVQKQKQLSSAKLKVDRRSPAKRFLHSLVLLPKSIYNYKFGNELCSSNQIFFIKHLYFLFD